LASEGCHSAKDVQVSGRSASCCLSDSPMISKNGEIRALLRRARDDEGEEWTSRVVVRSQLRRPPKMLVK
jgi:hypothetical protein